MVGILEVWDISLLGKLMIRNTFHELSVLGQMSAVFRQCALGEASDDGSFQ